MPLNEDYPKMHRNRTARVRDLIAAATPVRQERDLIALAVNDLADKAHDLNEIFERLTTSDLSPAEVGELLIAFELTVEQIRGSSDLIDGKLYELGDALKGAVPDTAGE